MSSPGLDGLGLVRRLRARAVTRALDVRLRDLVPALDARLRRTAILDVAGRVATDLGAPTPGALSLAGALVRVVSALLQDLSTCEAEMAETAIAYQSAESAADKRRVLEAFLRATVPQRLRARGDVAATARWLDLEAVQERASSRVADRVDRLEIAYRAIGKLAADLSPDDAVALASRGRLVEVALRSAAPEMHRAVRLVALRALERTLAAASPPDRASLLGEEALSLVAAWARGNDAARWVQIAAIELVAVVIPDDFPALARELLARRDDRDGMILRRNVLRVIAAARPEGALALVSPATGDPSEHVRQELARSLSSLSAFDDLAGLILSDPSPRVRGVALRCLAAAAIESEDARLEVRRVLVALLSEPSPPVVWRCALEAVRALSAGEGAPLPVETFVAAVTALAARNEADPQITEDAMATLRLLEAQSRAPIQAAREAIEAALEDPR